MTSMIDLNAISDKHYDWVERMGWHNKTVLESLALIASEIGEAAGECIGEIHLPRFGEELADIVLRCTDLAKTEGVNLNEQVARARFEWVGLTAPERIAEILVDYATWSNTARKAELGPDFAEGMGKVVARVIDLAETYGIDLHEAVHLKLAKNELRGTRGRPI
ncbi:hypothetical protein WJ96_06120 [Burkholderia ubonensis]|uniref:NTP pyrophosphohydrolase MazG putative catalytic core domain-containing protein n=2 Tax=Burkholderia ubonensis TaxID=101571 RepID=A0AAW3MYS2_9BURK|nr:hypothetical protein WJ96_06120 [Burkholderia ubonensis]KVZ92843.1 hypothetical protein WL25_17785 [Burkholderia ubonensis]